MSDIRPAFHRVHNGDKAPLPFAEIEYEARLRGLRRIMEAQNVQAAVLNVNKGVRGPSAICRRAQAQGAP